MTHGLEPGAAFALISRAHVPYRASTKFDTTGRATQLATVKIGERREVALGLDFGTSCVKVVMGDAALGKSFAVPFGVAEGVDRYLLPSRLFQCGDTFSLVAGTATHRDLKLALLANPSDVVAQQRVVAFLAIVIRQARGWLFAQQAAVYKRVGIVWKLAVGLPSANHLESDLSHLFERLCHAAWVVSCSHGDISVSVVDAALSQVYRSDSLSTDVEVTVVPEIAAQIYGFVSSHRFDKHAPNFYLMADVGAGTIDSSLFHVKQGKGGRWNFEFYTSVVEPNGVSNLHRHRVRWWGIQLLKAGAPQALLDALEKSKLITDQQLFIPESFVDYFDRVQVKDDVKEKTPDEVFFDDNVLPQVRGKTYWRTWKDGYLQQRDLTNIPFFMCGGGVRMAYYEALATKLSSMPGCSWLKAERWLMGLPNDLVVDDVQDGDYDRLSVAYGLSRLEVGKVVKGLPLPKLDIAPVSNWRDSYTDKDQC